jgi:UDP-N-acetylmuramoylalanine--D-glutamate ligase
MTDLENKRALVVGLGRSGEGAARFLVARGAVVAATDARPAEALGEVTERLRRLGVKIWAGGHETSWFLEHDLIVTSPGVPWDLEALVEARRRGIDVIGEVELASWFLRGRVIGVTGANGKTTTTALIGHLLREAGMAVQVGGNIGLPYPPAIDLVATSTPGTWNVLEVSSFQLESIRSFRAHIAVVLNVTPDHLDRHRTFEAYALAKGRILLNQQPADFAVLNADDPVCVEYRKRARGRVIWFSRTRELECGASVREGAIAVRKNGSQAVLADAAAIPIRGAHNLENTLAAATAAWLAGAPAEAIGRGVATFRAVEHRLEFVRRVRGVDYYNDSKATNVDAAQKALESFDGNLWVILGGKDKGSDYTVLGDLLRRKARAVLLIGAAAEKIAADVGDAAPLLRAGTLEQAVAAAHERAREGDTVLLAPACASFDQFENYEHRGRVFKDLVGRLE